LKLSLYHKAIALLSITFLVQIGLFLEYGQLVKHVEHLEEQEAKSRTVVGHLNWLCTLLDNAVLGRLGEGADQDLAYKRLYEQAKFDVPKQLTDLRAIFSTNPAQIARVEKLDLLSTKLLSRLNELSPSDSTQAILKYPELKTITGDIPVLRREILEEERARETIDPTQALPAAREAIKQQIAIAVALNIFSALILILIFTKAIANRLLVISENSMRLTRREPLLEPLSGNDEISALDKTLHSVANTLQQMSRRERAIIDHAVDVICSIDEHGKFMEVSPSSQIQWGMKPTELVGTDYLGIIDDADRDLTSVQMNAAREKSGAVSYENKVKSRRSTLDMFWSCSWSNQERAFFCTVRDISERKRLDLVKQQFVAMIGHDLRSPLASLRVYFDSLNSGVYGELTEKLSRFTPVALRNTERLIAMVNDLLDIEKLESGTFKLEYGDTSIDTVMHDSIEALKGLAQKGELKIQYVDCGEKIPADSERLTQVFINLLSNAIKYSPAGGTIEIGTKKLDDEFEISVQDEGRGVPEEYRTIIFDRFKQVEQSDNKRGKGTGLGLAICKAIVEQHKGSIGVEAAPGGTGSRFWVRLPLEL
jgi:PAS domain S-box-containing protein